MEIEDVLEEIEVAGDELWLSDPNIGTNKGKAYEFWVMLEIAVRLQRRSIPVLAIEPNGDPAIDFRLRGAPGPMPSDHESGPDAPSHFVLGNPPSLELHVSLQSAGASGAPHELDISVLPFGEGRDLREAGGGYYRGVLQLGLELKAYSAKHKLSHQIPRALIGVAVDLDPAWVFRHFGFTTAGGATKAFTPVHRTVHGLLTTTELFEHSKMLLGHHGVIHRGSVLPGTDQVLDEIVAIVETML